MREWPNSKAPREHRAGSAATERALPARIEAAAARTAGSSIAPVALVLGCLYAVFAVAHVFFVPRTAVVVMVTLASSSSIAMLALGVACSHRPVAPLRTHLLLFAMAAVVLLNSAVHLALVGRPEQTTNFMLLVIGSGLLFFSARWLALVIALAAIAWIAIASSHGYEGEWPHFGFAMLSSVVQAVLVFGVRRRTLEGLVLEGMRLENTLGELRAAHEELEQRVRERTSALETANQALVRQIAERRRAEAELRAAKEAAEAADRSKREFINIASHELKTPLTPLMLLLQSAERSLVRGQPVEPAMLRRLEKQAWRLTKMVDDLLDLSRLERGAVSIRRERLDLVELVSETVDDFRRQAIGRRIELTTPEQPVEVEGDATRLVQVVANLLDNALKYSPDDAPVVVRLSIEPPRAVVSVTDLGPGIPASDRARVFTAFYRAPSASNVKPGLGLGLFVARQIVTLHGGDIELDSRVGEGSTFRVVLPLAAAAESTGGEERATGT